jgi:hypothetical protein
MAEQSRTDRIGEFVLGFVLAAAGIGATIPQLSPMLRAFDKPNPAALCNPGQTRDCVTLTHGVIQPASDAESDISVSYNDGLSSTDLTIQGDSAPQVGTRVNVERWNNRIVSITERTTEHRYRTNQWPRGGRTIAKGALGIAVTSIFTFLGLGLMLSKAVRRG